MASEPKYDIVCALVPNASDKSLLASQKGIGGFRKLVVLKPVPQALLSNEGAAVRFLNDVKTAVCFSHPYIATTYEIDVFRGRLYLATEFVPGATLAEVVEACRAVNARVPAGLVIRAIRDAAYALHYAHTFADPLGRPRPLVHKSLTDRSILVGFDGQTKVLDFALPRPAVHDRVNGSFAAAELIRGDEVDGRADVFSLGAVAHACLTGLRFSYAEVLARAPSKAEFPPPSEKHPDVAPQLDAVLMRALYPSRESRYATMLELARELERVAATAMAKPEQCAASLQKLFPARRDELRALVAAAEERLTTAVMPLSAILKGAPDALLGSGRVEPTAELPAVADDVDILDAPPTRQVQSVDIDEDVPPTGQVTSPPKAAVRPEPDDDEGDERPVRRRRRPVLKAAIALVMLAVVAGAGAYVLDPKWTMAQVDRVRGRLGLLPPPAPQPEVVVEADAGENGGKAIAAVELPDAGEPDAGELASAETSEADDEEAEEPSDAGVALLSADGGAKVARVEADKSRKDSAKKKKKGKRRR